MQTTLFHKLRDRLSSTYLIVETRLYVDCRWQWNKFCKELWRAVVLQPSVPGFSISLLSRDCHLIPSVTHYPLPVVQYAQISGPCSRLQSATETAHTWTSLWDKLDRGRMVIRVVEYDVIRFRTVYGGSICNYASTSTLSASEPPHIIRICLANAPLP